MKKIYNLARALFAVAFIAVAVAGTNPINFELADVKATEGGDAEKFKALAQKGLLKVDGGMIVLMHEGVAELPNSGRYTLSLRVYNDGHSQTIDDVYTIIVGVDEPEPEQQNP